MKTDKFIDIRKLIGNKNPKLLKLLPGFIINYLKRVLHEDEVNHVISIYKESYNEDFCHNVIDYFNIDLSIEGIENIPTEGGVTLAMNHPLGGMDAMALVSALKHHRTDLRFIVNDILLHLDNLKGMFVGVNKHGKTANSNLMKIDEIFSSGKAVCIFPAGLVSRKNDGKVRDLPWKKTFVSLSLKHTQPIIPIFIDGELSNFFYRLSNFRKAIGIKANIEMFYLADELFKQKNKKMKIIVGKPILPEALDSTKNQHQWATWIQDQVYLLSKK